MDDLKVWKPLGEGSESRIVADPAGTSAPAPRRRGEMNLPDSEGAWYTMLTGLCLSFWGALICESGVLITLGAALCCLGAPIWFFGCFWYLRVRSQERARIMAETLAALKRMEAPECPR